MWFTQHALRQCGFLFRYDSPVTLLPGNLPDSLLCFAVRQVRFVLCHFTDNFICTAFRFTADGLFILPLCQHFSCDRFAISGPRLDAVVRDIPPHATAGDSSGIPRTTFTGDSHHHTAVGIITGNPDAILHIISQQALSVAAALQGHELRIPAALHPAFTAESPQSVSVIRGQWIQPDTGGLAVTVKRRQCHIRLRIFAPRCNKPCRTVPPGQSRLTKNGTACRHVPQLPRRTEQPLCIHDLPVRFRFKHIVGCSFLYSIVNGIRPALTVIGVHLHMLLHTRQGHIG